MGSKITKIFYSCGIIFLLTGLLLSAVNVPAMAQEQTPGVIDEPDCHGTITIQITMEATCCNGMDFNVTVTEDLVPLSWVDSIRVKVYADPSSAAYVQSISWTDWNIGNGLAPHEQGKSVSKPGTVTLVPGSQGQTITLWAEIYAASPSTGNVGKKDSASADNDLCYTPSPNLSLVPLCPDYDQYLNVWTLTNSGDAEAEYTCTGCTVPGGILLPGESTTLNGVRVDGTESIQVNYGDGQTASGDNTGVTDEEARTMQCDMPQPELDVEVTLSSVDCFYAYFYVTLENTGDGDAEGVVLEYQAAGAAAGTPTPTSTTVGTLAAHTVYPDAIQVSVPVSWLSENTGDFIEMTAAAMIGVTLMDSSTDKAYNPGNCLDPELSVDVVTVTEGCFEAVFEVTVTNNGDGTAHNVVVGYTPEGANVNGAPTPLSNPVGNIAPHSSAGPFTVSVPVDWANSDDFTLNIKLTADAVSDEANASGYALAYNQEICYTPDPVITLGTEDVKSCEIYPTEVCADFTLNITNLPDGSVVTVGTETFTADGEYIVELCGLWPGIGLGNQYVSIDIYGEALLDSVVVDDATAVVSYDPETDECDLPDGDLLVQDPFCYATHDGYKAAWQVINTSEFPIDFAWSLNGGDLKVETAAANDLVWLGNFELDVNNTVVVSWDGGIDEESGKILSVDCTAPTPPPPPPPDTPPVPVTAVEQPAPVVAAGVLIPVTGVDLGTGFDLGFFRTLMMYLGFGFLGMAFVVHALKKK